MYYERILSSRDRKELRAEEGMGNKPLQPEDILKDPYILDFLGIKTYPKLSESDLDSEFFTASRTDASRPRRG